MFKGIVYGVLIGFILTGTGWYFIGQTNLDVIRRDTERISREYGEAQQTFSSIRNRSDGLTETAARIADSSGRIEDGSLSADSRVKEIETGLNTATGSVNRIELRHRETIRIIGSNRDLDYEFRRLIDERSGEE